MSRFGRFFTSGGKVAYALILGVLASFAASTVLLARTAEVRYQRDVTRMVFNDNIEVLEDVRKSVGATEDTLRALLAESPETPANTPYVVVSIADRRLWYREGDSVIFETRVATGSERVLVRRGSDQHWKFETPRGRLVVQSKEQDPVWVPPDWHFVEQAQKRGLGLMRLNRGQEVKTKDGSVITVVGNDVVRRSPDGSTVALEATDGREIVAGGNLIVPPFGTNQRKYKDVLGTHRLNLGDGYALHGTNVPSSIGQAVSHGCVRLRNEDIETLYRLVPVGTPVYIY